MPISSLKFILQAFANSGLKNNIPQASSPITGNVGYDRGFTEVNMAPKEAGGIPPYGQDMNGILYDLSLAIQYIQSGISFPFDSTFATSIGGYAKGAIVSDASDNSILWVNDTANNISAPDVSGWIRISWGDPTEIIRGLPLVSTSVEARSLTLAGKIIDPQKLGAVLGAWVLRDVTASRSLGVTYTNTSRALMIINIHGATTVPAGGAQVNVSGAPIVGSSYPDIGRSVAVTAAIPPGASYVAPTGQMTLTRWTEVSL